MDQYGSAAAAAATDLSRPEQVGPTLRRRPGHGVAPAGPGDQSDGERRAAAAIRRIHTARPSRDIDLALEARLSSA